MPFFRYSRTSFSVVTLLPGGGGAASVDTRGHRHTEERSVKHSTHHSTHNFSTCGTRTWRSLWMVWRGSFSFQWNSWVGRNEGGGEWVAGPCNALRCMHIQKSRI